MRVVALLALQVPFALVGGALLAAAGRRPTWRDGALAIVLGTGATAAVVTALVPAGVRPTVVAWAVVAAAVAGAAGAVARRGTPRPVPPPPEAGALAAALRVVAVAVLALAVAGALRSSPWLDDAWTQWLPRGLAAQHLGLDPRLYTADHAYAHFFRLDYPLWWSNLSALAVAVAPGLDLRAMNGELALLAVACLLALPRLLAGVVPAPVAWIAPLLLALSPEFLREMRSGSADLPLGLWLGLFACASLAWQRRRDPAAALVAAVAAACAAATKAEGLPLLLLFAAVLVALAHRGERRGQAALAGAALVTVVPWIAWTHTHDVHNLVSVSRALDPGFLWDRAGRVWPAARSLVREAVDPTKWALIVPLALVLARRGRLALAPLACAAAAIAFLIWSYWADAVPLEVRLQRASYRVVLSVVLPVAFCLPLLLASALREPPDLLQRALARVRRRAVPAGGGGEAGL